MWGKKDATNPEMCMLKISMSEWEWDDRIETCE